MGAESIFEHRERVQKPRWRKWAPWVGGVAVLVIVGIALGIWDTTGTNPATPLNYKVPAKDISTNPQTVKLPPAARTVAKEFIETAVARKNLREAYTLAGPQIRQGQTLKQWMTGDISVVPYPVSDISYAPMKVDYSYPNDAFIEIALLPKAHSKAKSILFGMELNKIHGKWVVQSWFPRTTPPVPSAPNS